MAYQRHDENNLPESVSPYVRHDKDNAVDTPHGDYVRYDENNVIDSTQPTSVEQTDVFGNTYDDWNGDYVSN